MRRRSGILVCTIGIAMSAAFAAAGVQAQDPYNGHTVTVTVNGTAVDPLVFEPAMVAFIHASGEFQANTSWRGIGWEGGSVTDHHGLSGAYSVSACEEYDVAALTEAPAPNELEPGVVYEMVPGTVPALRVALATSKHTLANVCGWSLPVRDADTAHAPITGINLERVTYPALRGHILVSGHVLGHEIAGPASWAYDRPNKAGVALKDGGGNTVLRISATPCTDGLIRLRLSGNRNSRPRPMRIVATNYNADGSIANMDASNGGRGRLRLACGNTLYE